MLCKQVAFIPCSIDSTFSSAMPEPTAEELAEASAKMAAEFETQVADMRQYWEQHLGTRNSLARALHATPGAFYERPPRATPSKLGTNAW